MSRRKISAVGPAYKSSAEAAPAEPQDIVKFGMHVSIEIAMRATSAVSTMAAAAGDREAMYAANRAWHELEAIARSRPVLLNRAGRRR